MIVTCMYVLIINNTVMSVAPEVEVTASHLKIRLGGSTTLSCNVTRANPRITGAYIWRNENKGATLSEQSDDLLVTFSIVNDFGTYSCTVTNTAGEVGTGNVTITQGCKFTTINHVHQLTDLAKAEHAYGTNSLPTGLYKLMLVSTLQFQH